MQDTRYPKGRGAGLNTDNRFLKGSFMPEFEDAESFYDHEELNSHTTFTQIFPKTIVNKVESPDVGMEFSLNPYQGCEHGCVYCYARPTHEYWGYSAGLDFERKILVKHDAPILLEQLLNKKTWKPRTIVLSGNTDCYQPIE
jgi:DNA repair photolyase